MEIFLSDAQDYIVKKKTLFCAHSGRIKICFIIKGSGKNEKKKEMRVPMPVRRTESESPKVIFVLAKQNTKKRKEKMFVSESVSSH